MWQGRECPWSAQHQTREPPSPHRLLESTGRCCGWGIYPLPQSHSRHGPLGKGQWRIHHSLPFNHPWAPCSRSPSEFSSHSTFSSHLTSYEILLLTTPHITLSGSNSLNPGTLLPSFTYEIHHSCFTLTDQLLTPCDDFQQTALTEADFSCFPDGSYLKEDKDKYHARSATATPFEDTEAAPQKSVFYRNY